MSIPGFVAVRLLKRPIGWVLGDRVGDVMQVSERRARDWVAAGFVEYVDRQAVTVAAVMAAPFDKMIRTDEAAVTKAAGKRSKRR